MVGLINMLPMVITDGGQIFRLAAEKILNDKQKAMKLTVLLGIIFGVILIGGLIVWIGGLL
jgi:membrane-associated protease RseP (regulator of RpoE activity)